MINLTIYTDNLPVGTAGYATFHCIDQYFATTDKTVWAIKNNATVAASMYFTQNGGTTWGQIK